VNEELGVTTMYFGCNKSVTEWDWYFSREVNVNTSHQKAYKRCVKSAAQYQIKDCYLFAINNTIIWGKDAAFVKKVEKDIKTKFAKNVSNGCVEGNCINGQGTQILSDGYKYVGEFKNGKASGQGTETFSDESKYVGEFKDGKKNGQGTATRADGQKYVGEFKDGKTIDQGTKAKYVLNNSSYVFDNRPFLTDVIFTKSSPTTFQKLTFNKEKNVGKVFKRVKHSSGWKNKKLFRSFSFTAEYEDNIKVELLVEYDEDFKDFKKAEEKALYYSNMYGQMPHFLKTYNKKIYIHNDIEMRQGFGTWWAEPRKREFHINPQDCNYVTQYYSNCATTMVHELAHIIQELTGVISPSKWLKAKKLDNKKYCSKYSKKNSKEDFADSMVCWIVVRHKSDRTHKSYVEIINQYIPNRLKFFDEMNFNIYPM